MKKANIFKQTLVSLIFLFISLSFVYGQINVSISEILSNPDKYHNKLVQVTGKAYKIKHKVSKRGNPYTVFELVDEGGSVKVFSFNYLDIIEGDMVIVKGIYQKVKKVGTYTFYNEIDASNGEIKRIK